MKHEALRELRALIKLPDWTEFCPEKLREQLLNEWVERWIEDVEYSQSVVNTKYLTAEYNDIIKIKLAQSLAEEAAETCVSYKTVDKKITASMCAFRKRAK